MEVKVYKYKKGSFTEPKVDPFDLVIGSFNLHANQFDKFMVLITEQNQIIQVFNFYTSNNNFGIENKNGVQQYYPNLMEMLDKLNGHGISIQTKLEIMNQYNQLVQRN